MMSTVSTSQLQQILGWSLLHFLWQATLLGVLCWVTLRILKDASSETRYRTAMVFLVAIALLGPWNIQDQWQRVPVVLSYDNSAAIAESNHVPRRPITNSAEMVPADSDGFPTAVPEAGEDPREQVANWSTLSWRDRLLRTVEKCLPWIVLLWGVGVALMLARLTLGMLRLGEWRRRSTPIPNDLQARFSDLIVRAGAPAKTRLLQLESLATPVVFGYLRPTVIIPASLTCGMTPTELDSVLAHELAHLKRSDYLANLFQHFVEAIYFFHPAVWWLSREIRREREHCCDDMAVSICHDRLLFARALTRLEELRSSTPALAATGSDLRSRVERIFRSTDTPLSGLKTAWMLVLIVSVAVLGIATGTLWNSRVSAATITPSANQDSEDREKADSNADGVDYQVLKSNDEGIQSLVIRPALDGDRGKQELKWLPLFERDASANSITSFETLVSVQSPTKTFHTLLEAKQITFNLPEASKMRAEMKGKSIEVRPTENGGTQFTIREGRIELIDAVGVVRAWASPDGGAELLVVDSRIDADEVTMQLQCRRIKPDPDYPDPPVQAVVNPKTGAPENEAESPHGAVRYFLEQKDDQIRFRIKWRFDVDRLKLDFDQEKTKSNSDGTSDPQKDANPAEPIGDQDIKRLTDRMRWKLNGRGDDLDWQPQKIRWPAVNLEKPWQVFGRVTDADGRGLAGVEVRAHTGLGSLRQSGSTKTDQKGLYRLDFGPGILSENGAPLQVATISVSYPGHFEKNLHRQGDLLAALKKPTEDELWEGRDIEDVILPSQPKELNFVLVPAASFRGTVLNADGEPAKNIRVSLTGPELPPSSSVIDSVRTDDQGHFEVSDIPIDYDFQILVEPAETQSPWLAWASPSITFLKPNREGTTRLRLSGDSGQEAAIEFESLSLEILGAGQNWKQELKSARQRKGDGLLQKSESSDVVVLRLGSN